MATLLDLFAQRNERAPRGNVQDEVQAWAANEIIRLQSEVERLRGRCGELEDALVWSLGKLSIEVPVSVGNISYIRAFEKADSALSGDGKSWLLRKQAEAIEAWVNDQNLPPDEDLTEVGWHAKRIYERANDYAQRLRQQANKTELKEST